MRAQEAKGKQRLSAYFGEVPILMKYVLVAKQFAV